MLGVTVIVPVFEVHVDVIKVRTNDVEAVFVPLTFFILPVIVTV